MFHNIWQCCLHLDDSGAKYFDQMWVFGLGLSDQQWLDTQHFWHFLVASEHWSCGKRPSNTELVDKEHIIGYGSKLHHQGTTGFSPCLHLQGFHFGYLFSTHSHIVVDVSVFLGPGHMGGMASSQVASMANPCS